MYNIGLTDLSVGQSTNRLNDNKYHVVRFTRIGPNSTIQVDDLPPQSKHPTGFISLLRVAKEKKFNFMKLHGIGTKQVN